MRREFVNQRRLVGAYQLCGWGPQSAHRRTSRAFRALAVAGGGDYHEYTVPFLRPTKAGVPMPLETLVLPSSPSDSAAPLAAPVPVTVEDVLSAIVVDAASAAGEYLRDTEVPHGGE